MMIRAAARAAENGSTLRSRCSRWDASGIVLASRVVSESTLLINQYVARHSMSPEKQNQM